MYPVDEISSVSADLLSVCDRQANDVAFIEGDGTKISYAEFLSHVAGVVEKLEEKKLGKGSMVALLLPYAMPYYAFMYACLAKGISIVIIDPLMNRRKVGEILQSTNADLLVMDQKIMIQDFISSLSWKVDKWKLKELPSSERSYEIVDGGDEDVALLNYGFDIDVTPRGCIINYEGLKAKINLYKKLLTGIGDSGTSVLTEFPLFPLAAISLGKTVVLPRQNILKARDIQIRKFIDNIIENQVNQLVVSPALLEQVLAGLNGKRSQHRLKRILTGGTKVNRSLVNEAMKLHPEVEMEILYGTSEAIPISTTNFIALQEKMKKPLDGLSVGTAISDVKVRIIDYHDRHIDEEEFHHLELEVGQIGEVVCRGAHINEIYYHDEAAFSRNKITDRAGRIWHRTGDLGYFDGDELYIVGKTDRVMEMYGRKFYPYPIEFFIETEFGIEDTAYVQMKDKKFVLFIGGNPDFNDKALRAAIEDEGYPLDEIEVIGKSLPRDERYHTKLLVSKLIK